MLRPLLKHIPATVAVLAVLAMATVFAVQKTKSSKNKHTISQEELCTPNPIPCTPDSIATGKKIFKKICSQCHGPEAFPRPCKGTSCPANLRNPHLWTRENCEAFVFWTIRKGRPPMPSFKAILTEDQCWHVINYLHTLVKEQDLEEEKN